MKKILLLGDSIRMGYDKYVKEALDGVAEVYYPSDNCRFAQYLLRMLHNINRDNEIPKDIDLIHWNAGLWDVVELYGEPPLTPPDSYAEMIARIDRVLRIIFPNAKLIFANSTHVQEEKFSSDFVRRNATIEQYNAIALKALDGTDQRINDLYSLTKDLPESYYSDKTHFNTPAATKLLGDRVLTVICDELGITAGEVKLDGFIPERYDDKTIGY